MAPEHLTVYKKLKRLAKTAVVKANNAEMDAYTRSLASHKNLTIRLAKARRRISSKSEW